MAPTKDSKEQTNGNGNGVKLDNFWSYLGYVTLKAAPSTLLIIAAIGGGYMVLSSYTQVVDQQIHQMESITSTLQGMGDRIGGLLLEHERRATFERETRDLHRTQTELLVSIDDRIESANTLMAPVPALREQQVQQQAESIALLKEIRDKLPNGHNDP